MVQQQLQTAEETARNAAAGGIATAEALVTYGGGVVDALGDDAAENIEGQVQFVLDAAGPVADSAEATACDAIPPMDGYDTWGNWYGVEFCDDPVAWATIASNIACWGTANQDPEGRGLCQDPVGWLTRTLPDNCGTRVVCPREILEAAVEAVCDAASIRC